MLTNYYKKIKEKQSSKFIGFGLYLYFLGLSFRNAAKALKWFIKKSCFNLEVDTKIQTKENIYKEEKEN